MQQVVDDARQVEGIGGYLDLRSRFVDVFDRQIVAELLLQLQPFGAEQADVGLGDRERAFRSRPEKPAGPQASVP